MSVQTDAITKDGVVQLHFKITNNTDKILHTYEGNLPWSFPAPVVIAAAWVWGDILPHAPPPPPTNSKRTSAVVSIAPGETIEGSIPLSRYVEGLDEARRRGDVIIFWWYNSWGVKQKIGTYGGWLMLPKT